MFKCKTLAMLIAMTLLAFTSVASAGIIVLDTFETAQGPLTATAGNTIADSVQGDGILGGERDITVTTLSSNIRTFGSTVQVTDGIFAFAAEGGVIGQFGIVYDGIDNSSEINTSGLADASGVGIDFTDGDLNNSFQTDIVFSDTDFWWSVEVWWANGTESELLNVAGIESEYDGSGEFSSFLPFEYFEYADWTDVSALSIVGNIAAPEGEVNAGAYASAFDVVLDNVEATAVPEPSPAPLMAMGIGLLLAGRQIQRRKQN